MSLGNCLKRELKKNHSLKSNAFEWYYNLVALIEKFNKLNLDKEMSYFERCIENTAKALNFVSD